MLFIYWHTFGPSDNYHGKYGIEFQVNNYTFTLHLLPRFSKWGYTYNKESELYYFSLGYFLEIAHSNSDSIADDIFGELE